MGVKRVYADGIYDLFHFECIEEWNLINKSCPLCKHEIKIF